MLTIVSIALHRHIPYPQLYSSRSISDFGSSECTGSGFCDSLPFATSVNAAIKMGTSTLELVSFKDCLENLFRLAETAARDEQPLMIDQHMSHNLPLPCHGCYVTVTTSQFGHKKLSQS